MSVAAAEIAGSPALRVELRALKDRVEATIQGCGDRAVLGLLAPLVEVFGISETSRRTGFWKPYLSALSDLPLHGLIEACDGWCKRPDAEFFPKPGPLRDMALKACAGAYRAVAILRAVERLPAPSSERRAPTPEEIAEVRRLASLPLKRVEPEHAPARPLNDRHAVAEQWRELAAEREGDR